MTFHVNDSGSWKEVKTFHVKDSGSWKPITDAWVKDAGSWKKFYTTAQAPDYNVAGVNNVSANGELVTGEPFVLTPAGGSTFLYYTLPSLVTSNPPGFVKSYTLLNPTERDTCRMLTYCNPASAGTNVEIYYQIMVLVDGQYYADNIIWHVHKW